LIKVFINSQLFVFRGTTNACPILLVWAFVCVKWKWQVRGRLRFLFNFEFCHTSNKRLKATQGYPKPVIKWEN